MLQYQQMETLTYDRQATFLAEAEQRRLAKTVAPAQVHPCLAWVGQQLMVLGQHLQGERQRAALPVSPVMAKGIVKKLTQNFVDSR